MSLSSFDSATRYGMRKVNYSIKPLEDDSHVFFDGIRKNYGLMVYIENWKRYIQE